MKHWKKITLLLLSISLSVASLNAERPAQGGGGPRGQKGGHHGKGGGHSIIMKLLHAKQLQEKLNITEDQLSQLKAIVEEAKANRPEGGREGDGRIKETLQDPNSSEAEIRVATQEMANHMANKILKMREMKAKVDAILTEEQKKQLEEMKSQHGKGKPHGKRKGGPKGGKSKRGGDENGGI